MVSISVWRKLKSGVFEPWSDFKLAVESTQPAVRIQAKCAIEGSQEDSVTGLRSRLKVSSHAAGMYMHAVILHQPASFQDNRSSEKLCTANLCGSKQGWAHGPHTVYTPVGPKEIRCWLQAKVVQSLPLL